MSTNTTREDFIHAVRAAALRLGSLTSEERAHLAGLKLVYGSGAGTRARGVTYFGAWRNGDPEALNGELIEVCAFGEENLVQLAGTTIHELAHALAGHAAGHSDAWKTACARLGLRAVRAAGTEYRAAMFAPALRTVLAALPAPTDGKVTVWSNLPPRPTPGAKAAQPRPCSQGIGTRGGKSRGKGSGSRLRKHACECGVIVRAARDVLEAHCDLCGSVFTRRA